MVCLRQCNYVILTFFTELASVWSKAFAKESVAEGMTNSAIFTRIHLTRWSTVPVGELFSVTLINFSIQVILVCTLQNRVLRKTQQILSSLKYKANFWFQMQWTKTSLHFDFSIFSLSFNVIYKFHRYRMLLLSFSTHRRTPLPPVALSSRLSKTSELTRSRWMAPLRPIVTPESGCAVV